MKKSVIFGLWLVYAIIISQIALATDQYRPYLHNPEVPENPGLKLQGSYQTALWPGAATYSYGIDVPPGRNGLQPSLGVSYNSHSTSQRPGIVGTAWTLSQNYIWRDVDYSFADASDDKFNLVLNGQSYELVYVPSEGRYHTKIESFLHITKVSGGSNDKGEYWIVKAKDGTAYRFGYNTDSELVSNLHNYVARWSLDLVTDTHGNEIYYSYSENPTPNDIGAVYPLKIEYNNEKARVVEFVLESSDRPDKWLVYEQGNKVREVRRIKEIVVKANGNLVRKYALSYTTIGTKSFLSSVTLVDSDGTSSMPPTTFEYNSVSKGWVEDSGWATPVDIPYRLKKDEGMRIVDFNRDGLVDIAYNNEKAWLNTGSGWVENSAWNAPHQIVDSNQYDTGMRFMELNGDGLTDIVRADGPTDADRDAWINTGEGWSYDAAWHLPTGAHPINEDDDNFDRGRRFVDLNGDGRDDILGNAGSYQSAWMNTGSGWTKVDGSWAPPPDAEFVDSLDNQEDQGVRIADVNGDGLPDLMRAEFYHKTWLNTGSGWVQDDVYAIPLQIDFVETTGGQDEGVRLADVNGDGLTDLLVGKGNEKAAWINTGSGWVQDENWNVPELAKFTESDGDNKGVRIADVNGDGLPDILKVSSERKTWLNKASKPYLLNVIKNEFGGKTSIDYTKSTLFDNTGSDDLSDLGFNMWIVERTVGDNGVAGAHNVLSKTDYSYLDGLYDYDDREFRGFNSVQEIQTGNSITAHWFHQDAALKGMEYRTEVLDSSSLPFKQADSGFTSTAKDGYNVVELSSEEQSLFDGSNIAPKVTLVEYSYDSYGNILSTNYFGEKDAAGDEKNELWQFVYNSDKWIVDKPLHYILTILGGPEGKSARQTFYRYDDLPYGSAPVKGDRTWEEQWLDGGTNPVVTYKYDDYGNLIEAKNARGFTTSYEFGMNDPTFTFAEKTVNPAGHAFLYSYDLGTGNLMSETDANGNMKSHSYDVFGRIKKDILPYDTEGYPTKEYTYFFDGTAPESVKVSQRENSGSAGTFDTHYFYDGFGKLAQLRSEAENSKHTVTNFYYDALGRLARRSNPYFDSIAAGYVLPKTDESNSSYAYDALSRVVRVENPDKTGKSIGFDHWKVTYLDERGNRKTFNVDAYDNIRRVTEYVGNNYYTTEYSYDLAGDLVQVEDAYSNQISYAYDTLGRKVRQEDPDLGAWEYSYDENGNIVAITDNSGKTVNLEYDDLDRVVEKKSGDDVVKFFYDDVKGTLTKTESSDVSVSYDYDKKLRKTRETTSIDGRQFVSEWAYDSADRVTKTRLPDSSEISYDYNSQGLVEGISGVLADVGYNPVNAPFVLSYGNGLITSYSYDPDNFRIHKISTGNKQELAYSYDALGNIVGISENAKGVTEAMVYDELNRLTSWGRGAGETKNQLDFEYDALGDIAKVSSESGGSSYNYGNSPRHSAAKIVAQAGEPEDPEKPSKITIISPVENLTVYEGNLITLNVVADYSGQGELSYSISSPKFSHDNNVFKWQTAEGDAGVYPVAVTASDGTVSDTSEINISVKDTVIGTGTGIFDDFNDGVINDSIWIQNGWDGGTLAESDGALHFETGSSNDRQVRTKSDLGKYGDFVITFRIKVDFVSPDKNQGFWLGNLAEGQPSESTGHRGYYWQFHGKTSGFNIGVMYDGKSKGLHDKYDSPKWEAGKWHSIKIERADKVSKFYFDSILVGMDDEYAYLLDELYWLNGRTWKDPREGEEAKISVDDFAVSAAGMQAPLPPAISIHDDFGDGIVNSSIWVQNGWSGGTLAESDGNLYFETGSSSDQQVRTLANIGAYDNFTLMLRMKIDYVSGDKNSGFWLGNLAEGEPGESTGHRGYYWQFHGKTSGFNIVAMHDDGGKGIHGKYDPPNWEQGKWHDLKVERAAGVMRFYFDGKLVGTDSTYAPLLNELYWNTGRTWKDPREGESASIYLDDFSVNISVKEIGTGIFDNFGVLDLDEPSTTYELIDLSKVSKIVMYDNESRIFGISAEDPDDDALTYTWLFNGTVVSTSQNFTFTPEEKEVSEYNVTIIVNDGKSETVVSFILAVIEAPDCQANADARPCQLQLGVCSGSNEKCDSKGKWPGCTAATYLSYSGKYEAIENSCDGLDNDCDGLTDEGFGDMDSDKIADCVDDDNDNDGTKDEEDDLIGKGDDIEIKGEDKNIKIEIKEDKDDKGDDKGRKTKTVRINNSNKPLLEFSFNFSKGNIMLRNLSIEKQKNDSKEGFTLVRGLDLKGKRKQVFVDRIINSSNAVCIKDKEVAAVTEVSSGCNNDNETLLQCDFPTTGPPYGRTGWTCGGSNNEPPKPLDECEPLFCQYIKETAQYQVYGLKHSAVLEQCTDADLDTYLPTGCSGGLDCNDNNPSINPAAVEVCNGVDDNCNGQVDENRACNTAPILQSIGNRTVSEKGTLSFAVAATDSEGDILTYNATKLPQGASFSNSTAAFSWTPTFEQSGVYAVTFNVSDGLAYDYETINVTVANVNRAPVFETVGNRTALENAPLSFTVSVTDPDGDSLAQLFVNVPERLANAQFSSSTKEFKWAPTFDDSGTYTIWFTASDGQLSTNEFVNITVLNVNRPPRFENLTNQTVFENSTLQFFVNATDPDNQALEVVAVERPAGSAFTGNVFSWKPTFDDAGSHSYETMFELSDGQDSVRFSVNITVLNVNRLPVISGVSGNLTVNETETVTATISATDADGDSLTYAVNDSRFSQSSPGRFEWSTGFSSAGTYTVLATASDGSGAAEFAFAAAVKNVNRAPRFENVTNQTVLEDSTLRFFANATDPDGDSLLFRVEVPPQMASAKFSSGMMEFEWLPKFDDSGTYAVKFITNDTQYSASAQINVTVVNVNRAPAIMLLLVDPPGLVMGEGETKAFSADVSDPDSDDVTVEWKVNGETVSTEPQLEFKPKYDDSGEYKIELLVSDYASTTTTTTTLTVQDTLDCGTGQTKLCQLQKGVCANSFETCADSGKWLGCGPANYGSSYAGLAKTNYIEKFCYDFEKPNTNGCKAFCDGLDNDCDGEVDEGRVCNTKPQLQPLENKTVKENETLQFTLAAADAENDALTFTSPNLPFLSSLSSSGEFTWTPGFTQAGSYLINFTVGDDLQNDSESVKVTVINVNRAPEVKIVLEPAGEQGYYVKEGEFKMLKAEAYDPDGDYWDLSYKWWYLGNADWWQQGKMMLVSTYKVLYFFPNYTYGDGYNVYKFMLNVSDGKITVNVTVDLVVVNTQSCQSNTVEKEPCGSSVGACKQGMKNRTCGSDFKWTEWTECLGEVKPAPKDDCGTWEDEDCDGVVNNGCTESPDLATSWMIWKLYDTSSGEISLWATTNASITMRPYLEGEVLNKGDSDSPPALLAWYLNGRLMVRTDLPRVNAGKKAPVLVYMPYAPYEGMNNVSLIVDADKKIKEKSENNNQIDFPITVTYNETHKPWAKMYGEDYYKRFPTQEECENQGKCW